jgi:hypothetical protein
MLDREDAPLVAVDPTPKDRAAGRLLDDRLRAAVEGLRTDGLVLLNDVVDLAHLDVLHERMIADLDAMRARPDVPYNWTPGNLQQNPPPFPPYLFEDVLLNPYVISVTAAVLGPGVKNVMYGGNIALPGEHRQPVHSDVGHLWPIDSLEGPHPPAQLVVNMLTVDVSQENGATEIWPGSHRELGVGVGDDVKISPDQLEQRRAIAPPFQPTFRRGCVLIRDIRLWHAGMPNRTDQPRPMIAMIHSSAWLGTETPLLFPTGTESFFDHPVLRTAARFTDGPIDYLAEPQAFEYEHAH